MLNAIPEEEKIHDAIFNMSPPSSAGPDGYTGRFFQKCWQIIKKEVIDFFKSFLMVVICLDTVLTLVLLSFLE